MRMNPDQQRRTQFSIFYVVAGLLLVLGLQWFLGGGATTDVAYSDFKKALSLGKVQDLSVSPSDIQGTMVTRPGRSWHSTRRALTSPTS